MANSGIKSKDWGGGAEQGDLEVMAVTRLKQGTPERGKGPTPHPVLAVPTQGPGLGCTGVGMHAAEGLHG